MTLSLVDIAKAAGLASAGAAELMVRAGAQVLCDLVLWIRQGSAFRVCLRWRRRGARGRACVLCMHDTRVCVRAQVLSMLESGELHGKIDHVRALQCDASVSRYVAVAPCRRTGWYRSRTTHCGMRRPPPPRCVRASAVVGFTGGLFGEVCFC